MLLFMLLPDIFGNELLLLPDPVQLLQSVPVLIADVPCCAFKQWNYVANVVVVVARFCNRVIAHSCPDPE